MWNDIKDEIVEHLQNTYDRMKSNIILLHGNDTEKIHKLTSDFNESIKTFSNKLYEENENEKLEVVKNTEKLYTEYLNTRKELQLTNNDEFDENDPLIKINLLLKDKLDKLHCIMIERKSVYEDLLVKQKNLNKILKEKEIPPIDGIPSLNYLTELSEHVESLYNKKNEFKIEMKSHCRWVVECLNKLELTPTEKIEHFCIDKNSVDLPYNVDTLKKVKDHIKNLQNIENNMKSEAESLRNSISYLYNRIYHSLDTRENVMAQCNDYNQTTINMLKKELKNLEKLKAENLKFMIENAKKELIDWMKICLFSEDEMASFAPLNETHFNDDVLSLLELEINRLKLFYKKYANIYDLIEQRKQLWEHLLHLESVAKDSKRLLSRDRNMCKILREEEKERKMVQKNLPKIEDQLKLLLHQFKETEQRDFTIHGQCFLMIMNRENENFNSRCHLKKSNTDVAGKKRQYHEMQNPVSQNVHSSEPTYSAIDNIASCNLYRLN